MPQRELKILDTRDPKLLNKLSEVNSYCRY